MNCFLLKNGKGDSLWGKKIRLLSLSLYLLLCCQQSLHAQLLEKKINLNTQHYTGLNIIAAIKAQYPSIRFSYDENVSQKLSATVKIETAQPTIKVVLELFKTTLSIDYKNTGDYIILSILNRPNVQAGDPGSLKGRIVEFETSQPLPGATIYVTELQKGMQSNLNGYYMFNDLPPGRYTLQASFIGYTTEKIQVEVKTGKEQTYDVKMQGSGSLQEVVVNSVRRSNAPVAHTSERQLVTAIKNSQIVVSGISSEQISKSADRNASEAVRKIAGISVRDDKFIVIRGMNERYNLTYLNDNIAPSTELYSRAFALDLLPTRIIDRILVYKSPAPDLLADMTGGAVKIYTKDARNVKHFDIELQTGYRPNTTFNKNFLTYQGGKTDFLGFDDGTRKLPATVPVYGDFTHANISQKQYAQSFSPVLQYGYMTGSPLIQITANYYNTFKVAGHSLSLLGSLSYKNESQQNNVYRLQAAFDNPTPVHSLYDEIQSQQTAQLTWLQNFTYSINNNNTITFKNFLLQQGQSGVVSQTKYNDLQYGYFLNGLGSTQSIPDKVPGWYNIDNYATNNRNIILSYTQRFLYSGNLTGTHHSGKQDLQWNAGYTYSRQDIPDQRVSRFEQGNRDYMNQQPADNLSLQWSAAVRPLYTGEGSNDNLELGIISRTWSRNTEKNYNASIDYTYKWKDWITLKAGTYQQWKERVLFRRVYTVNEGDLNSSGYPNNAQIGADGRYMNYDLIFFKEQDLGKVWSPQYLKDDGTALKVFDRTNGSNAYTATEQNNSGYIAASLLPFDSTLDIYGGLRVEYDRQKVAGALQEGQQTSPLSGGVNVPVLADIKRLNWLPSINIGYRPDNKWVLRAAYGKTVNRTEFRELSPYSELDFLNNQIIYGNATLKPAQIDNYDLRAEWYPGSADQANTISIGAFYKNLTDPIERMLTRNLNFSTPTYISFANAQKATVQGVEIDIRQQLSIIPGNFFRHLSIIANGSLIKSEVTKSDSSELSTFGAYKYKRQLQGQAPYILNGGLYYENGGSGTKISIIYNYIGPRIYAAAAGVSADAANSGGGIVQGGSTGSLIELARGQLDASLTQRIVKSLQLKFSIQNLLNSAVQMAEDANYTYKYEKTVYKAPPPSNSADPVFQLYTIKGDLITSSYKPYPYFNLTLTYSF